MTKKLHRSLRVYLSKLKKIKTLSLQNTPRTRSLLLACKYPKTPSFSAGRHAAAAAAGGGRLPPDGDRFLFENFHSLYLRDDDDDSDNDDSAHHRSPTPLDAIKPSDRFFVSLGTSNSLVDKARTSGGISTSLVTPSSSSSSSSRPGSSDRDTAAVPPVDSVAVLTLSKDPYDDFRRSMQDMVLSRHAAAAEAGRRQQQPLDWDFMEELLFCYLELNDRSVHKYVLKAFTDLTVSFRRRGFAPAVSARRRRRRKVVAPAAEEKGKDCYYSEKRKHMET